MRELEFLPAWYPRLRRRRKALLIQVGVTLALGAVLCGWLTLMERSRRKSEQTLQMSEIQRTTSELQLHELDRLGALEQQLRQQEAVYRRLGVHVESVRLVSMLSEVMPSSMSLLSLHMETEETPQQLGAIARAGLKDPKDVPMERRMRVRLAGVAPTDGDIADLITKLNKVSFFDRVAMVYAKDRRQQGYVMREFELTFTINLEFAQGA